MPTQWRATIDEVIALQDGETDARPAPGLQWFPSQWLGDAAVQLMDWTARGLHHHLLMVSWKGFDLDDKGIPASLPDDLDLLEAICQHPDGWPALWGQVKRAWKLHEGRWWNLGLCRSYLAQMKKRAQAKDNAEIRWKRERARKAAADAFASPEHANASKTDAGPQCSSSSSSSSSSPASAEKTRKRPNPVGDRSDLATKRKGSRAPSKAAIEIAYRVEQTWSSLLRRRLTWYDRAKGAPPSGRPPTMTEDIKADIRRSLQVHDAALLSFETREEWQRDSKTRAAGEGMYLKEWNIGIRDEDGNGDSRRRASTFLEPWRPWKIRKGRDPVDEYAEVYFQKRAAHEAASDRPSEAVQGYLLRKDRLDFLRQLPEVERDADENEEGLDRFEEVLRGQLAEINGDPALKEELRRAKAP